MDDLTLFSETHQDMQLGLNIITSFNLISHINSNVSKSNMIILHDKRRQFNFLDGTISCIPKNTSLRSLGVYIASNGSLTPCLHHAQTLLHTTQSVLARKRFSPTRIRYLLHTVIYPALYYLLQHSIPASSTLNDYDIIIRNILRKTFRLHRRTPRSVFHSTLALNVQAPSDYLVGRTITDTLIELNSANCNYAISDLTLLMHDSLILGNLGAAPPLEGGRHSNSSLPSHLYHRAVTLTPPTTMPPTHPPIQQAFYTLPSTSLTFLRSHRLLPQSLYIDGRRLNWPTIWKYLHPGAHQMPRAPDGFLAMPPFLEFPTLPPSPTTPDVPPNYSTIFPSTYTSLSSIGQHFLDDGTPCKALHCPFRTFFSYKKCFFHLSPTTPIASTPNVSLSLESLLHHGYQCVNTIPHNNGPSPILIWTDGSFLTDVTSPSATAAAWCPQFHSFLRAKLPPNIRCSFLCEIWGIILSLLLAPAHSFLTIHCDCKGLVTLLHSQLNSRRLTRQYASIELSLLFRICHEKHLHPTFRWVKAHSIDKENTTADTMAASAHSFVIPGLPPPIGIFHLILNTQPISDDPTRTIRCISAIKWNSLFLERIRGSHTSPSPDLRLQSTVLSALRLFSTPSSRTNFLTRFRLRALTHLLPTSEHLYHYTQDSSSHTPFCSFCPMQRDNDDHFLLCSFRPMLSSVLLDAISHCLSYTNPQTHRIVLDLLLTLCTNPINRLLAAVPLHTPQPTTAYSEQLFKQGGTLVDVLHCFSEYVHRHWWIPRQQALSVTRVPQQSITIDIPPPLSWCLFHPNDPSCHCDTKIQAAAKSASILYAEYQCGRGHLTSSFFD